MEFAVDDDVEPCCVDGCCGVAGGGSCWRDDLPTSGASKEESSLWFSSSPGDTADVPPEGVVWVVDEGVMLIDYFVCLT